MLDPAQKKCLEMLGRVNSSEPAFSFNACLLRRHIARGVIWDGGSDTDIHCGLQQIAEGLEGPLLLRAVKVAPLAFD